MTTSSPPEPGRSAAPAVSYGLGAITEIPNVVAGIGGGRVMLVCGRTSFEASGADRMLPELERLGEVERWSGFRPNTDSADLAVGLEVAREFRPDIVLGIGGGSALDMAKLLVAYQGLAAGDVVPTIEAGGVASSRRAGLVLAPTTSGSGAEATHFAVVYVGSDKHSIAGPVMRADAIILDPGLTLSSTAYQRATSGIDAVAQAIESLWATGATDRSRRFARHALRLLLPALEPFVNRDQEVAARAMTIGSHLAGRAIDISKTTAAHALSYGLTTQHSISHGHAVALTLGAFIEAHAQAAPEELQEGIDPSRHRWVLNQILERLGASDPGEGRSRFATLMQNIGLETRMSEFGIEPDRHLKHLASTVNVERLTNNPVSFDAEDLLDLLRDVYA